MATLSHKYVRIRNHNSIFDVDAEEFIHSLELRLKTDIKALPQWKELIKVINKSQTDYKIKLENAEQAREAIIRKLYTQYYRLSPFELTDYLIRTANLWKTLKSPNICVKISSTENIMPVAAQSIKSVVSDEEVSNTTAHPNTEIIQSKEQIDINSKTDNEIKSNSSSHLPTIILTNQHKILSPFTSPFSLKNLKYATHIEGDLTKSIIDDDIILRNETKSLKCHPDTLLITDDSPQKQTMKFTIKNCVLEHIYVQFKSISDSSYFDNIEIIPATPIKLNPGLTKTYKCIFKLKENVGGLSIVSSLYFRAGRNVLNSSEAKVLRIPILSNFKDTESVNVTETIYIPHVYQWQVTAPFKYPKGVLIIHVKNNKTYNLYIRKKEVDLAQEYMDDLDSLRAENSDTGSLEQEMTHFDNPELVKSKILSSPKILTDTVIDNLQSSVDIVMLILNDIVSIVLQPFIFKNTYLRLLPKSKKINIVYFTKAEHIGYHQSYFDLIFTRRDNHNIVFVKTVKVYAEILSHPVVIAPNILDMTQSPVIFGYCKGNFTINNTNRTFSATIKIKTTAKTKEFFKITPERILIAPRSKAAFEIRMCINHSNYSKNTEEYAYFILQVCCTENNIVFRNAPPLFYEIIAPCDPNFNKYLANNIINI